MSGLPNYISRRGAERLGVELRELVEVKRPLTVREVADAAAQGDRSENAEYIYGKKRLREIDRRIRFLTQRLDRAVVVDVGQQSGDRVLFGAVVEVRDENGTCQRYQLVGEDEIDPGAGLISWRSPLGSALMRRLAGDVVSVRRPAGDIEIEIMSVRFE